MGESILIETIPRRGYRLLVPVREVPRVVWSRRLSVPTSLTAVGIIVIALMSIRGASTDAPFDPGTPALTSLRRNAMVAVLPFKPLEVREDRSFLADALTEEVTTELARRLPIEIGVIARTSTMRFKEGDADLSDVAQLLTPITRSREASAIGESASASLRDSSG